MLRQNNDVARLAMESLDYWRLCDELTVIQALILILGGEPSSDRIYSVERNTNAQPKGYEATRSALTHAILGCRLPATIVMETEYEALNIHLTRVTVADLKVWLISRGIRTGFFFPDASEDMPDYLSDLNTHYAPKLAAALNAWLYVTQNPDLLKGKTPKQAIEKWLREHAASYGLTKEDGSPNEQGIDEIAKVANWKPTGGVAKTPGIHLATN